MHTYRKSSQGQGNYLYTVGFVEAHAEPGYNPRFTTLADFTEEWKAACYASFLNGGVPPYHVLTELFPHVDKDKFAI